MFGRAKVLLAIGASALAMPAAAQAPASTTAFDGTYAGYLGNLALNLCKEV